ncbi:MAG: ATP-binding protein [Nanoarchaeota archaeon]|nr:ATP-binding protein [Nanoarchaeota archaeon]
MNKKELLELIALGEGQNLEFKESFSSNDMRRVIKNTICGFANSEGGKILVGVRDDGSIKGIRVDNNVLSQAQQLGRQIDPHLNIRVEFIEKVLLIEVFRSSFVHSTIMECIS